MPDFLVFAALVPKVRGARVILDLHDPSPELMMTIFGRPSRHWFVRTLRFVERMSIGFSDLVLTPNVTFRDLFASRSCRAEKVNIVMNSPEPTVFDPDRANLSRNTADDNGEFRVMHHGLIAHRHGVDLLVEAIALLRPRIAGIRLDIFGSSTRFLDVVLDKAAELGIKDIVRYQGSKTQVEIAEAIVKCHVGVVPNRRSVFTEINFPTRLFEYLAMQRPVVAPNTRGIRDYFKPDEIVMFEPGDVQDLAAKIFSIYSEPDRTRDVVARGLAVYRQHLWHGQKAQLIDSVSRLV
jgi:glycosyltransferase involved in cell wall biosynthesis